MIDGRAARALDGADPSGPLHPPRPCTGGSVISRCIAAIALGCPGERGVAPSASSRPKQVHFAPLDVLAAFLNGYPEGPAGPGHHGRHLRSAAAPCRADPRATGSALEACRGGIIRTPRTCGRNHPRAGPHSWMPVASFDSIPLSGIGCGIPTAATWSLGRTGLGQASRGIRGTTVGGISGFLDHHATCEIIPVRAIFLRGPTGHHGAIGLPRPRPSTSTRRSRFRWQVAHRDREQRPLGADHGTASSHCPATTGTAARGRGAGRHRRPRAALRPAGLPCGPGDRTRAKKPNAPGPRGMPRPRRNARRGTPEHRGRPPTPAAAFARQPPRRP